MYVEKRDGMIQPFDFKKIERVVERVFSNKLVNEEVPEKFVEQLKSVFDNIINKYSDDHVMDIEDIQDTIRDFFIKKNKYKAVDAFIKVCAQRAEMREKKSWLIREITKKIRGCNVENQNANVDEASFGGRMGEAGRVVTKDYALKYCMSKKSRKNHEENINYIHDLDSYAVGMHNCLSVPFDRLLKKGFDTRQTDVRKANSVNTASQLVAVLFQLQSLQEFGGVSATHLDWTMVPYIRKSFEKHYIYEKIKRLPEFKTVDLFNISYEDLKKWVAKKTAEIFVENNFTDEDFRFDNKENLEEDVYQCSLLDTRNEIYQAVEGMYHNLNTLQSRSGNQLPFTSINYGTCTEPEGRMFTKALLEVSLHGLGKFGTTSIFPCGIFQYKKGVNDKPGTPNYDLKRLALKSTSKRLYPNYANCDWTNQINWKKLDIDTKKRVLGEFSESEIDVLKNRIKENPELKETLNVYVDENNNLVVDEVEKPYEMFSTMGCRTANGFDVNFEHSFRNNIKKVIEDGTLYDDMMSGCQKDGRGNICPITIILPEIAMMAKQDGGTEDEIIDRFFNILKKKISDAKDTLIDRFRYISSQSSAAAKFMYDNKTMYGYVPEEGIVSALRHGTLALGQLGVAETLYLLVGEYQTGKKGLELAKKIEQLYKEKCDEYKKEYTLNFGVYYTPAESLCFTAFKKFKAKYGDIEGVTYFINSYGEREEKLYFTNSIHVPVYEKISPFEKIDIESQLTGYSSAGCITYIEVEHEIVHNIDALEEYVDYAMEHDIPYFAVNCPSDTCKSCGYQGNIGDRCPICGSENIERLRRVTGYLTGDYHSAFNEGKQCETDDRVKHKKIVEL